MECLLELTDALSNGTIPTPYGLLFPKIGGSQPSPKTPVTVVSGTGEAMDFKFGRYIQRVHLNKRPLKILVKRERGHMRGLPKFLVPSYSGTGKAMNFKFCMHIGSVSLNKSPLKISRKIAVGILRDSRKFLGHPCDHPSRGHCDISVI